MWERPNVGNLHEELKGFRRRWIGQRRNHGTEGTRVSPEDGLGIGEEGRDDRET